MGRFILASERMATFTDVTAYVVTVALTVASRKSLLMSIAPVVLSIREVRPDDTGFNYKRGKDVPEEITAQPLRVSCPRALADLYRDRQSEIEMHLGLNRKMTFKEFCKLAFLTMDYICGESPILMMRIVKAFPPSSFGL